MFAERVPIYHSAPYVIGWPWTFGPSTVPLIVIQTALYAIVVYHLHPEWGLSMLHMLFVPVQFTLQTFQEPLAFFILQLLGAITLERDFGPGLQGLLWLIRAWLIQVNLEMTLIKVLWPPSMVGLSLLWMFSHPLLMKLDSQKCLLPKWIHSKMSLGFMKIC